MLGNISDFFVSSYPENNKSIFPLSPLFYLSYIYFQGSGWSLHPYAKTTKIYFKIHWNGFYRNDFQGCQIYCFIEKISVIFEVLSHAPVFRGLGSFWCPRKNRKVGCNLTKVVLGTNFRLYTTIFPQFLNLISHLEKFANFPKFLYFFPVFLWFRPPSSIAIV